MVEMILFDVDGVILSEERYFDASALTVWELIHSPNYLGINTDEFTPSPDEATIRRVRREIFDNDHVLHMIKNRGINANWDMVYLTFSCQLLGFLKALAQKDPQSARDFLSRDFDKEALQQMGRKIVSLGAQPDYTEFVANFENTSVQKQEMLTYLNTIADKKTGIATSVFSRNSKLWDVCQKAFQEWYLGNDKLDEPSVQTGKRGFLTDEIPIVEPKKMQELFHALKERGLTLGIGTGRPEIETIEPLASLGLLEYFEENRIATAKDVLVAERQYPEKAPLSKPQPFTFVYGRIGKEHSAQDVIDTPLPFEDGEKLLVVGDSPADFYAARSIGARFAAVLTGLSGQKARAHFEELGADHILNDLTEVKEIV
ncbi:MAG TPA: HAD family hydrolase [Bacillales bacterium]|nr:HAD family hydrolase [Bacillales bacterium]